jgi:hypothetical protein
MDWAVPELLIAGRQPSGRTEVPEESQSEILSLCLAYCLAPSFRRHRSQKVTLKDEGCASMISFAHFAAFSSRTLRLESFDLSLEQELLIAKFA